MTPEELKQRTKAFALRVIRMFVALPKNEVALILGRQALRSGTSVGAHYREASRARSTAEFISKIEVGSQELDETAYWMELLVEGKIIGEKRLSALMQEANELLAIFTASARTAKRSR